VENQENSSSWKNREFSSTKLSTGILPVIGAEILQSGDAVRGVRQR
jgi:hypothetical protein